MDCSPIDFEGKCCVSYSENGEFHSNSLRTQRILTAISGHPEDYPIPCIKREVPGGEEQAIRIDTIYNLVNAA